MLYVHCTCCDWWICVRRHGVIVYRTILAVGALIGGGVLDLGEPVHDYAQVRLFTPAALSVGCTSRRHAP